MASRHPAQPSYLTTGTATGHPGTVKPPGMTRKSQADRVIGLPRQKSIEYTTIWVNRASAPWPVGTLPGIHACELEAHSVHLISRCVGALEGHSTDITRRIYRIPRKKGSFLIGHVGADSSAKSQRSGTAPPRPTRYVGAASAAMARSLQPHRRHSRLLHKKNGGPKAPVFRHPGKSPCPGNLLTC